MANKKKAQAPKEKEKGEPPAGEKWPVPPSGQKRPDAAAELPDTDLAQITKSFFILSVLGVASCVSQAGLSPVFGGIPTSIYHSYPVMAGCFLGWAGNVALRHLPFKTADALPIIALYLPTVQFFLSRYSDILGNPWGPVVIESLTLFPLALFSAASVADYLEGVKIPMLPKAFGDAVPGMGSWAVFKFVESLFHAHLPLIASKGFLYTRVGLSLVIGALYTLFSPSKYIVLAVPALLHTALWNTNAMIPAATQRLNDTLLADNWVLLDRRESVTGYLSVLESVDRHFRVMRCDHSLLGGQWNVANGLKVPEPIYGVFVMLEAVRLAESQPKVADTDASALVIGLGIGTTPSALVSHGIDTTVVEIDPAVHDLAVKHFDLKQNREPVLKNAVKYTAGLVEQGNQTFDYVIHDVFTGGAEPVDLFTLEFLEGLSALLKPDGVIAINYAGDFKLPAPKVIVNTITTVFPTCRFFRESAVQETSKEQDGTDFTNMVIFCKKTEERLTFRKPVAQDFLRSRAREVFLEPKNEVQQADLFGDNDDAQLLRKNNTDMMTEWHHTSALGHWTIMRQVIPTKIWELW